MNEDEVIALLATCSNVGRWGRDDERGTLNYITPDVVIAAAKGVVDGRVVSLAHDLDTAPSPKNSPAPIRKMLPLTETGCLDTIEVSPHGFAVTHLDALGHVFFEGAAYNGRPTSNIVVGDRMTFASVYGLRDGFTTRGVLLDVARARGVPFLGPNDGVTVADLEEAERMGGVRVGRGDAVFVRIGLAVRETTQGTEDVSIRCGLTPECIPWLHEREVAAYSGDCVEQMPSGFDRMIVPLHQVGLVAMGLVMLDNTEVEELARTAAEVGRWSFMVVCAPLRIPGGTGSPVNPVAIF
jgi:kynurenine formamidase